MTSDNQAPDLIWVVQDDGDPSADIEGDLYAATEKGVLVGNPVAFIQREPNNAQAMYLAQKSDALTDLLAAKDAEIKSLEGQIYDALFAIAVRLAYCPQNLEDARDGVVAAGTVADYLFRSMVDEEPVITFAEMIEKSREVDANQKAEIERLREALKAIVRCGDYPQHYSKRADELARAALAEGE